MMQTFTLELPPDGYMPCPPYMVRGGAWPGLESQLHALATTEVIAEFDDLADAAARLCTVAATKPVAVIFDQLGQVLAYRVAMAAVHESVVSALSEQEER